MSNLALLKKRFFIVFGILGVIDLVLVAYLVWPGSSSASRKAEEHTLQEREQSLSREVGPLRDIDQKLVKTRSDITDLYQERIPSRWSDISSHLERLKAETGVASDSTHYSTERSDKNDLPDVQRVSIDTNVKGDYSKVARFINAMEQDKLMFIIDKISLTGQENGIVSLQISFETFLRATGNQT